MRFQVERSDLLVSNHAMLGILNQQSRNEGRAGGQYYEYESNVRVELV